MTVVGLIAVLLSMAAIPFSSVRMTTGRLLFLISLLVLHLAACVGYYLYAETNPGDTSFYYYDTRGMAYRPLSIGTMFVVHLVHFLKHQLGATYLDCFLVFQTVGFWGIVVLVRIFDEIHQKARAGASVLPYVILFAPSIHFWTSAIGKDAPLFFAISLCTWSCLNFRGRLVTFSVALAIMVLFRVHIALIVFAAVMAASIIGKDATFGRKAFLLVISIVPVVVLAGAVGSSFNIDLTSSEAVYSFFEDRENAARVSTGATTIVGASFVERLASLLFRPFFFDADTLVGTVASVENIGSVFICLYLMLHWRKLGFLTRRVFFVRYAIFTSLLVIFLLAMVYYNVGLGLRQRVMAMPTLFSIFVSLWVVRHERKRAGSFPPVLMMKAKAGKPAALPH